MAGQTIVMNLLLASRLSTMRNDGGILDRATCRLAMWSGKCSWKAADGDDKSRSTHCV